jgi:chromosome segregation ATPase
MSLIYQAKLKEVESQAKLNENIVDHQHSGKDLRVELRKLKQAYKTLSSEKDRQISALTAEKDFVWNQFKTMEQEYTVAIKSKNMEAKQATEAAQKLQQNVDELQEAAEKKDDEIIRLQAEVTNAKEKMLILEDELQQMHSLVKARDDEAGKNKDDQPERTHQKLKKDIKGTNRKPKSEGPFSKENSRTPQVTPDRRDVKTSRTHASDCSQKRKRGSSISCVSILFWHLHVYTLAIHIL